MGKNRFAILLIFLVLGCQQSGYGLAPAPKLTAAASDPVVPPVPPSPGVQQPPTQPPQVPPAEPPGEALPNSPAQLPSPATPPPPEIIQPRPFNDVVLTKPASIPPPPAGALPKGYPDVSLCTPNEGFCETNTTLYQLIDRRPYDRKYFDKHAGGGAAHMLGGSGSLNIPVIARAGLYFIEPKLHRSWFNEYFDTQLGAIGFQSSEILSNHYAYAVVDAVVVAMYVARREGHQDIFLKARQWLRAYWAVNALAALDRSVTQATYHLGNRDATDPGNYQFSSGYSSLTAGPRTFLGGGGGSFQGGQYLLTVALDHPGRRFGWSMWGSPIGIFLRLNGFTISSLGKSNIAEKSVDPIAMGLTSEERQILNNFITSYGTTQLNDVLSMIAPYHTACDLTFMRTASGVISWMGTSTTSQGVCNRNKGPYFAASMLAATGSAEFLRPTMRENPSEDGYSYRDGQQICALTQLNVKKCMPIPIGEVIYEVSWTKSQGVQRVQ